MPNDLHIIPPEYTPLEGRVPGVHMTSLYGTIIGALVYYTTYIHQARVINSPRISSSVMQVQCTMPNYYIRIIYIYYYNACDVWAVDDDHCANNNFYK